MNSVDLDFVNRYYTLDLEKFKQDIKQRADFLIQSDIKKTITIIYKQSKKDILLQLLIDKECYIINHFISDPVKEIKFLCNKENVVKKYLAYINYLHVQGLFPICVTEDEKK